MSICPPDSTLPPGHGLAELNLDSLSGPFVSHNSRTSNEVIGTMLAMFLQGITLHQGGVFWLGCRRSREPIIYMVTVAVMQVLDFAHTASCINTVYEWTVREYGNPAALAISPWSFMIEPVMAAVTATTVHLFYAHRILLIADGHCVGKLAAAFIATFTFVQLAFGTAVSSKIVLFDYHFDRFISWLWGGGSILMYDEMLYLTGRYDSACVWLGTLAALDIAICITYTFYLNQMSGPFVHSTQMVLKVALVVLATNGASAVVAVTATILFGTLSGTNWHAIPQLCLQKMLILSLLVCLNARSLLSDMIGADPQYFHSHLKRQPLGIVPSSMAGVDGNYQHQVNLSKNFGTPPASRDGPPLSKLSNKSFLELDDMEPRDHGANALGVRFERDRFTKRRELSEFDRETNGSVGSLSKSPLAGNSLASPP
ncbi:DUF6534 domain-containing protein [Sporobolomyces koalae]|uniref:DUF6534 domain-containing protein n=1 Tax=Sporobolomyces koalae TaxID=500713 RepID=UPI003181318D